MLFTVSGICKISARQVRYGPPNNAEAKRLSSGCEVSMIVIPPSRELKSVQKDYLIIWIIFDSNINFTKSLHYSTE